MHPAELPIKSSRGVAILTATQSTTLRVVAEATMPAFHFRRPRWPSRLLTADALRRLNIKAPGRRCINIIRNWNAPCCSKPETAPMGKLHKGNKFRFTALSALGGFRGLIGILTLFMRAFFAEDMTPQLAQGPRPAAESRAQRDTKVRDPLLLPSDRYVLSP